jgi:hypothetical protein
MSGHALSVGKYCQSMPENFGLPCRIGCWFSTGGGSVGQVESRGLSKWGGAGIFSRLVFYLDFVVDPSGSGWHKQIKAGSKYHANNQEKES